jgi:uncharacterized surface protein with fasciclin (FAS1) repeats
MRRFITTLLAGVLFAGLMAVPAAADDHAEPTIAEIVVAASSTDGLDDDPHDYDILLAAVLADEFLLTALSDPDASWTVFAPTDKAFMRTTGTDTEAAAVEVLASLGLTLGSPELQNVVLYHVLAGEKSSYQVFVKKFWKAKKLEMVNGDILKVRWFRLIDGTGNRVFPKWKAVDIQASNGVVHTIKEVLLP